MGTFEMPEFYMPYPARVNPHLEGARVHAKAWAREMGILDSPESGAGTGVWDEHKFDSMDFALFVALTHPDASGPELDLLADWYVWAWYFDDFFLHNFMRGMDVEGGREYIDRLVGYVSADGAGTTPADPVEAGLVNLWARTLPGMSEDWSSRFAEVIQNHVKNTLLEVFDATQDRMPNPIEYVIEVRRRAVGMDFVVYLLEHALGVEIPPAIASIRPLRVIKESFADSGALRNDIFSYEKEVLAGEVNGVMVVERFLGCDVQRAADVTNELATSRMQQFENTAVTELFLLFEEYRIDLKVRLEILRYVKGLQDWMAGDFQWMNETARYKDKADGGECDEAECEEDEGGVDEGGVDEGGEQPTPMTRTPSLAEGPTGLGTAAARLGLARRAASVAWPTTSSVMGGEDATRVTSPEFYMPFTTRCNPHLDTALVHAKEWAEEIGLLDSGLSRWDESSFDSMGYVRLVALMYPDASGPDLDMIAKWMTLMGFLDDFFEETFTRSRDSRGGKNFLDRLPAFAPISDPGAVPVPTNLVERGLADLWPRTAPEMSESWRRWYSDWLHDVSEGFLWEIFNLIERRISDPVDYIEMRRKTNGPEFALILVHYAMDLAIPSEVYDTQPMSSLVDAFLDWAGLFNDVFSYQSDVEDDSEINNAVLVIKRFLDCDQQQAVEVTNDLVTSQLHHFEHIVAAKLPVLAEWLDLDTEARASLDEYVEAIQYCIAGLFENYQKSRHYGPGDQPEPATETEAPAPPPRMRLPLIPTGLGTTAARIGSARIGSGSSSGMSAPAPAALPHSRVAALVPEDSHPTRRGQFCDHC